MKLALKVNCPVLRYQPRQVRFIPTWLGQWLITGEYRMLSLRKIGLILAYAAVGAIGSISIAVTLTVLAEIL